MKTTKAAIDAAIMESATRRTGRPAGTRTGAAARGNTQHQAARRARILAEGGRIFTLALTPAATAACESLRAATGITSDRAIIEVVLLWTSRKENASAIARLLREKVGES